MKRYFCFIIFWMVVFGFSCSILRYKAYEIAYDIIRDLGEEGYIIESKEIIYDFDNNSYIIFNLNPQGYLIVNDDTEILMEGSFTVNSPYSNYNGEKHYLGPLNYIIKNNEGYYSIYDNRNFTYSDNLQTNSMKLNNKLKNEYENKLSRLDYQPDKANGIDKSFNSGIITLNTNGSINDAGWTKVIYHHYFSHLNYFPENKNGTCGFVALSMVLGYLDTFYNDETIPNERFYKDGRYYYFTKKSDYTNTTNSSYIPHNLWERSPGTTQDLHDILFDYGHYIEVLEGYLVCGSHLRYTFNDYMDDYINVNNRNYYDIINGSLINTHKNQRK